ncbi:MAG: enhanced serine sensitivity protein SseB C-terminal domain-containing protein [Clostridiales bacterium]|nr:enhanced serine sensitivity protein SseB C-terminal domain-containing protein [Clostridiales bacterium]
MGLFGRKGNNAEKNEENKQESVAIKYPFFTLLVEEVLSMTSTEVSVIGNVRGDLIEEGQELFLLGRNQKSIKTRAVRIEDTLMSKMPKAEVGENVSVVLQGLRQGDVDKYDVLSTVNSLEAEEDASTEAVNPYLTGLLREAKRLQEEKDFMGRIMENIATEAKFLSPCMHQPGNEGDESKVGVALLRGKDGKNYLAAFTDSHELELMDDLPEKMIQPIDFTRIMLIANQAPVDGLLINPKTEGFVITRTLLDALNMHKRKLNSHIREQKLDPKQPIMLAVPKEENMPQDLFDALCEHMKKEPRILRAWYGLMVFPKEETKSHLIIIDTLEEVPEVFGGIGDTARPFLNDMPLNMQSFAKVGQMTENLKLFYERTEDIVV